LAEGGLSACGSAAGPKRGAAQGCEQSGYEMNLDSALADDITPLARLRTGPRNGCYLVYAERGLTEPAQSLLVPSNPARQGLLWGNLLKLRILG
jgi:hypothetical protein